MIGAEERKKGMIIKIRYRGEIKEFDLEKLDEIQIKNIELFLELERNKEFQEMDRAAISSARMLALSILVSFVIVGIIILYIILMKG